MNILIALLPAIGWGVMPLITGKVGGSPVNQIFGIGAGTSIIGLTAFLITRPSVNLTAFCFALLCGALWTIGQIGQFISFKRIGVSNTFPLSTVFQLVGNSIIGVLIFGDWPGAKAKIIGVIALIIVIVGALCTSVSDQKGGKVSMKDAFLLCTTVGFWILFIISKHSNYQSAKWHINVLTRNVGNFAGCRDLRILCRQAFFHSA